MHGAAWMNIARLRELGVILAVALALLAQGCATPSASPPRPDESALVAAGFKVMAATTAQQKEHLQRLPADRLTELQRTGAHYFVYADSAKNQLYVGTPKEYAAYQRLRPGEYSTPAEAADMASCLKQDAAMQKETARDLADPYFFWPSFGLLW